MALSHRVRALNVVRSDLLNIAEVGGRVFLGWRHWSLVAPDRFPILFVDVAETGGAIALRSGQTIEGEFLFDVWGYTKPLGPFPNPDVQAEECMLAREAFLKVVVERLLAPPMHAALIADNQAQAGGIGVTHLAMTNGPDTDAGLVEGFGLFRQRVAGRVHVTLTNF